MDAWACSIEHQSARHLRVRRAQSSAMRRVMGAERHTRANQVIVNAHKSYFRPHCDALGAPITSGRAARAKAERLPLRSPTAACSSGAPGSITASVSIIDVMQHALPKRPPANARARHARVATGRCAGCQP